MRVAAVNIRLDTYMASSERISEAYVERNWLMAIIDSVNVPR